MTVLPSKRVRDPGGVEIFPVASYNRNRDKLLPDESLDLHADVGGFRSDIDLVFNFSDWKAPSKLRIVENFQPQDLLKQNYDSEHSSATFKKDPKEYI